MKTAGAEQGIVEEHGQDAASQPCGVYLISPSGAVQEPEALALALQRLAALGFPAVVDRCALAVDQRFAGSDAQRLQAIARALQQPLQTVMITRGGYGLGRLLPHIDWRAVADSGKRFVGFSDFTAFNLALLARTGAQSFSGAAALADFGGKRVERLTQTWFVSALRGELEPLEFSSHDAPTLDAHGVLWGGNLAMVASLLGTPYFPEIKGGILFLEDVGEAPYRIERMLVQLWQAGVLAAQNAIVLGQFTQYRLAAQDNGYDLDTVVRWLRATVNTPVICGLPYGHTPVKATLPVGRPARLTVGGGTACLHFDPA